MVMRQEYGLFQGIGDNETQMWVISRIMTQRDEYGSIQEIDFIETRV